MNDKPKTLTVRELLTNEEYVIPLYQRSYAWTVAEMSQLIRDIADYAKDEKDKYYYLGNLITSPKNKNGNICYDIIDGQQRVVTLVLITSSICHNQRQPEAFDFSWYTKLNVSFKYREKSQSTLEAIFSGNIGKSENGVPIDDDIYHVYKNVWRDIEGICRSLELNKSDFFNYFFTKVRILRVNIPDGSDLNHYFEIINTRSVQLEQYEVVKALMMEPLKDKESRVTFDKIWKSIGDMDGYVQLKFEKETRIKIFEENGYGMPVLKNNSRIDLFNEIREITGESSKDETAKSLADLIKAGDYKSENSADGKSDDSEENHKSIITFPNFLLHVLKILNPSDSNVTLDDKRLIKNFRNILNLKEEDDKERFVKEFIITLLIIRCLFDKYVIKRHQNQWVLERPKLEEKQDKKARELSFVNSFSGNIDNEKIMVQKIKIMLFVFHMSYPTQNYKHWLNAVLRYLYLHRASEISIVDYFAYLDNLAKSYMLDIYLADSKKALSFDKIIYENNGCPQNSPSDIVWENINIDSSPKVGGYVENFVFNFYDFLLWSEHHHTDFSFEYRTSVEHFYPQQPLDNRIMDDRWLHSFGNLCLVSSNINSKFGNNLPRAKLEDFGKTKEQRKSYSLKLQDMMECVEKDDWDEKKIEEKEHEAKERIKKALTPATSAIESLQ